MEGRIDLAERHAMGEQLDGRPAAGQQAAEPEGDERAEPDQTPEDGASDVRHLDFGLAGARPALRAEGSVAVAAAVAFDVETVEEVVERKPAHRALGDEPADDPEVEPQEGEPGQRTQGEEGELRAEPRREDVREADALIPDRIGPDAHSHGEEQAEEDQDDYERDPHDDPAAADVDLGQVSVGAHGSGSAGTSVTTAAEDTAVIVAPTGTVIGIRSV